jgi:hypothetical protein
MTTGHDPLPAHLDRIGRQLTAAAEQLLCPTGRSRHRRTRSLFALPVAAATAAAVVVATGTTATAPPAYALTPHGDGTYTVSLTDIATGIPALNVKFKQLGIDETAVPIEASCNGPSLGSGPWLESQGSMRETVTVGNQYIDPGLHGDLAAEELPNGQVLIAMGTTGRAIPSCFAPPRVPVRTHNGPQPRQPREGAAGEAMFSVTRSGSQSTILASGGRFRGRQ